MQYGNGFCFIGLGNPGTNYEKTRHNVGFLFLDFLASTFGISWEKKKHFHLGKISLLGSSVFFLKPMQFMNLSGFAVKEVTSYYKISLSQTLVCYDDLAFKVGDLRLKPKGSAGGHNGLASIIEQIGSSSIPRLRFGVTPSFNYSLPLKEIVLSKFSSDEMDILAKIFLEGKEVITSFIEHGLDKTMSMVNRR